MKRLLMSAAAFTIMAGGALAQSNMVPETQKGSGQKAGGPASELQSPTGGRIDSKNPQRNVQNPQVPVYQKGSGQSAGGPANELNNAGRGPATTGTVNRVPGGQNERQPSRMTPTEVPAYQRGSGQESGGPAKELNRN